MAWSRVTSATLAAQSKVSATSWNAGNLGAAVQTNDKLVATTHTESIPGDTGYPLSITAINDSLGNTWHKDLSQNWNDSGNNEEMAVWSTVSASGTPSNITLTISSAATVAPRAIGCTVAAYRGLSTASGASGIDISAIANAVGGTPTTADSGTTGGTTTAANELKVGFYSDPGYEGVLTAGVLDTVYSINIKQDGLSASDNVSCIEDADSGASGSTARATLTETVQAIYGMAVVVYKLAPVTTQEFFGTYPPARNHYVNQIGY